MAKCVQVVGQGVPVRMPDADAFQLVDREKDGQYCSKRTWKELAPRRYVRIDARGKFVEWSNAD